MSSAVSSLRAFRRTTSTVPSTRVDGNDLSGLDRTREMRDDPETQELNRCLRVLVDLFPDIRPEVFREMLTRVSPDSRVEIVADQLLRRDGKYVQGRYRGNIAKAITKVQSQMQTSAHVSPSRDNLPDLLTEELFRSEPYKKTVKMALYDEFRSLSHATIKAVLAENNDHYTKARAALLDIAARSWRSAITDFFYRRKTPSVTRHPFIDIYASRRNGRPVPKLRSSGNVELDRELYNAHVQPAEAREVEEQKVIDNALAHQIAEQEAKDVSEEYDCEVCYTTVSIHKLVVCDDGGHFICHQCVQHTITEAVYGQGWPRSISNDRRTMKCVAPMADDCRGCIPIEMVQLALTGKETQGESLLDKFEQRAISNTLQKIDLPLAQCPFCSYAEVDDLATSKSIKWRLRNNHEVNMYATFAVLCLIALGGILLLLPILPIAYLLQRYHPELDSSLNPFRPSLLRLAQTARGLRFTCLNPACGKRSCLRCHASWRDPHLCYSTQISTLEKSIEAAQTLAIKRVCPHCNLSFVKSSGCNKMVCTCGYAMCYLCRAEIPGKGSGYEHFCQHFRVAGGGVCRQCEKCDLYREEDEVAILRMAREKAVREWKEGVGGEVDVGEVAKIRDREVGGWWDPVQWTKWLDMIVDRMIVIEVA